MATLLKSSATARISTRRSRTTRSTRRAVVVRAEGEEAPESEPAPIAKVERTKDSMYFGGIGASATSMTYLDGTLPGDAGFDPLGLLDPEGAGVFVSPSWLTYAEVIHGRWAMLGTAGCIAPEILGKAGVIPEATALPWFKSGVIPPAGAPDYWCDPYTLFLGELTLMGFAEIRRLQDYRKPGSMGKQWFLGMESALAGSGNPAYPGGQFFNMFNLGKDDMDQMKLKEIKNGRLAMGAWLGYAIQAFVTGKGPFENLCDHIYSNGEINILTNLGSIGGPLA